MELCLEISSGLLFRRACFLPVQNGLIFGICVVGIRSMRDQSQLGLRHGNAVGQLCPHQVQLESCQTVRLRSGLAASSSSAKFSRETCKRLTTLEPPNRFECIKLTLIQIVNYHLSKEKKSGKNTGLFNQGNSTAKISSQRGLVILLCTRACRFSPGCSAKILRLFATKNHLYSSCRSFLSQTTPCC